MALSCSFALFGSVFLLQHGCGFCVVVFCICALLMLGLHASIFLLDLWMWLCDKEICCSGLLVDSVSFLGLVGILGLVDERL